MTKKLYDLAVKTREYTDNSGETKAVWQNVGAMMESNDGKPFLMLEAWVNLAAFPRREGSSAVLVSCFEPREQDGRQSSGNGARSGDRGAGATSGRNGAGSRSPGSVGGKRDLREELDEEVPF